MRARSVSHRGIGFEMEDYIFAGTYQLLDNRSSYSSGICGFPELSDALILGDVNI